MTKLKNVKIVSELLQGTSKFQTRKTVGFSDVQYQLNKTRTRELGEIWAEVDANDDVICWWEQKDGYKVKYNVHPTLSAELQKVRENLRSFPNCPKETCTCTMPRPIDIKFRVKTGMCEDCTITHETKLKIRGEFKEYAIEKMRNNALAFFKDADLEVEAIKESLGDISYVTADGEVETWTSDNRNVVLDRINEEYSKFKQEILEAYGG